MFYDSIVRPQPERKKRRKSKSKRKQAPVIKFSVNAMLNPWSIPLHKAKNKCDIKKAILLERESPDHRPPPVYAAVELKTE